MSEPRDKSPKRYRVPKYRFGVSGLTDESRLAILETFNFSAPNFFDGDTLSFTAKESPETEDYVIRTLFSEKVIRELFGIWRKLLKVRFPALKFHYFVKDI